MLKGVTFPSGLWRESLPPGCDSRSTAGVSDIIVPSGWRERIDELQTRRSAWIVAGFAVVAVGTALLMWLRGSPAQIAPPATQAAPSAWSPGATTAAGQLAPSPAPGVLYVDVSGAVRKPGLYRLDVGSRVADAIQAAGGASPRADLSALNLAELLTDGVKVDVVRKGDVTSAPVAGVGAAPSPSVPIVNINTADEPTLELIPGVGPVTANAILAYRDRIGRFSAIEQLLEVNGIGPATVENIRPYITI
jgi:competence protein ComEA